MTSRERCGHRAVVAVAGAALLWTAQPAAAADYDKIRQIAEENGIT